MSQLNSYHRYLDRLIRKHSAFRNMTDLVESFKKYEYRPSIYLDGNSSVNREKLIVAINFKHFTGVSAFVCWKERSQFKLNKLDI